MHNKKSSLLERQLSMDIFRIGKYTSGENDERAVAQSFLVSAEFKQWYGDNVNNINFVETLYINVLGRDYDQEGITIHLVI